jgi:GxxExxY protein
MIVKLIYPELSYKIVGAAMEVHRVLGPGYLESVFQKALAHEMTLRLISFEQFKHLPVIYKGIAIGDFEADFVVDEKIILELKAITEFHPKHEAQAINYLAATSLKLAILLNFGADSLQYKRAINRSIHAE